MHFVNGLQNNFSHSRSEMFSKQQNFVSKIVLLIAKNLKFKAKYREFAKILRLLLEQFLNSERSEQFLQQNAFLNFSLDLIHQNNSNSNWKRQLGFRNLQEKIENNIFAPFFQAYFFDQYKMTDGQPPNDRGCRACGKIGHLVRDCPKKKASDDHKKARKDNKNNAAKGYISSFS